MARHFQNWLKAYMSFTSDSEAPDDFHFWSGVWTVAGALRRRVWVDMRKFQWTPNFYIILVGPPGMVTKSTVLRAGRALLEQVPKVNFGPTSCTWQALADSLATAVEHIRLPDNPDGTPRYLPMSCLNISTSELGTFLKTDDGSLVDVLTDLWDGQLTAWGHKTKTSGNIDIKNPWLNILGCTTPSWIRLNFPNHMIGGGLTSRIVFVYGDKKRRLVPYPDEMIPSSDYKTLEQKLLDDLTQISTMQGEYKLSPLARAWGKDWYVKHWGADRPIHMASDRYEGYLARKQTHIHKLAIVIAAAQSDDLVIEREHLQESEMLLNSSEPHMMKVFESVGVVDEAKHIHEITAFVKAHKMLTTDELWALVMNLMEQRDFNEAVQSAVRGGVLKVVFHPSQTLANGQQKKALVFNDQPPTLH